MQWDCHQKISYIGVRATFNKQYDKWTKFTSTSPSFLAGYVLQFIRSITVAKYCQIHSRKLSLRTKPIKLASDSHSASQLFGGAETFAQMVQQDVGFQRGNTAIFCGCKLIFGKYCATVFEITVAVKHFIYRFNDSWPHYGTARRLANWFRPEKMIAKRTRFAHQVYLLFRENFISVSTKANTTDDTENKVERFTRWYEFYL